MTPYEPPAPESYRLPSMGRRAAGGALLALPFLAFYVGVPYGLQRGFATVGVPFPYDLALLTEIGIVLTALGVARYLARPSRWFGPAAAAYALGLIAYLAWLAQASTIRIAFQGATIALGYGRFIELLMLGPILALAAALVTTAEDALRPAERYPFDFPP